MNAFQQGREACSEGRSPADCPYAPGGPLDVARASWHKGFRAQALLSGKCPHCGKTKEMGHVCVVRIQRSDVGNQKTVRTVPGTAAE